jgi:HAT1-interacting factor 1
MASEQPKATRTGATDASVPEITVETALEHARRAFALKKYEQAVEYYATALELQTKKHGEDAPETANLYFSYGKALLENAISQASVLGKEQPENGDEAEEKPSGTGANGKGPILSFSGDADEGVDLFGQAAIAEEEGDEEDAEGEDGEPEDDFNAAWEVLELARAIYEKSKDEDDEVKMKLAETYIALGDVSLETEKFDQAITDYSEGLALKLDLLPNSSRQIAEAHYKLSIVLDLTSGRLSDAILHAEKALESVCARLAELHDGINGELLPAPIREAKPDKKGKGKAVASGVHADSVCHLTKSQMEAEIKECEGVKEDLALKVEELKTTPSEPTESAPAMAARALDAELNAKPISVPGQPAVVNDLTSLVVKKKKKAAEVDAPAKRRADDGEDNGSPTAKKAKLEEDAQS